MRGSFMTIDAAVALMLMFVIITAAFAYYQGPSRSDLSSAFLWRSAQDTATVLSKSGALALPLSSHEGLAFIRSILEAAPDGTCLQVAAYGESVPDSLAAHWRFDEEAGRAAADSSGSGLSGSGWGAIASQSQDSASGGSKYFNGSSCIAVLMNNTMYNFGTSTNRVYETDVPSPISGDLTISIWVRTSQSGPSGTNWWQGAGIVDTNKSSALMNDFGISLLGSKAAFGTGQPDTTIVSLTAINDGKWHHIAAKRVQATGEMRLYVDGREEANATGGTGVFSPTWLTFGCIYSYPEANIPSAWSESSHFIGNMDEAKLYSRALSAQEILLLYSNPADVAYSVERTSCPVPPSAGVQTVRVPFVEFSQSRTRHYYADVKSWQRGYG